MNILYKKLSGMKKRDVLFITISFRIESNRIESNRIESRMLTKIYFFFKIKKIKKKKKKKKKKGL